MMLSEHMRKREEYVIPDRLVERRWSLCCNNPQGSKKVLQLSDELSVGRGRGGKSELGDSYTARSELSFASGLSVQLATKGGDREMTCLKEGRLTSSLKSGIHFRFRVLGVS